MRRCERCVLPDAVPKLRFDEWGVCSVCREWDERYEAPRPLPQGAVPFAEIVESLKTKKRGKYDCVLALSGGKDSCYAAYLLKQHGLEPLAVNLQNWFQTDLARTAIAAVTERLKIDLLAYAPERENYLRFMRESFIRTGNPCIGCNLGIYALCQRVAQEEGAPAIILGGGSRLEGTMVSSRPDLDFLLYAREVLGDESSIDWSDFVVAEEPSHSVSLLFLADYVEWRHAEILEVLENELDIRYSEEGMEYHHADCEVAPVKEFIQYRKNGFTSEEFLLSSLVRDGQLERQEALDLVHRKLEALQQEPSGLPRFLDLLGMSREDYDTVLRQTRGYRPPWYHGESSVAGDDLGSGSAKSIF